MFSLETVIQSTIFLLAFYVLFSTVIFVLGKIGRLFWVDSIDSTVDKTSKTRPCLAKQRQKYPKDSKEEDSDDDEAGDVEEYNETNTDENDLQHLFNDQQSGRISIMLKLVQSMFWWIDSKSPKEFFMYPTWRIGGKTYVIGGADRRFRPTRIPLIERPVQVQWIQPTSARSRFANLSITDKIDLREIELTCTLKVLQFTGKTYAFPASVSFKVDVQVYDVYKMLAWHKFPGKGLCNALDTSARHAVDSINHRVLTSSNMEIQNLNFNDIKSSFSDSVAKCLESSGIWSRATISNIVISSHVLNKIPCVKKLAYDSVVTHMADKFQMAIEVADKVIKNNFVEKEPEYQFRLAEIALRNLSEVHNE